MNTFNKQIISHILPVTILLLAVSTALYYPRPNVPSYLSSWNNTSMWWFIYFIILAIFIFSNIYFFDRKNKKEIQIIGIYLLWNVICILRGAYVAEIYWDWKGLVQNSMALILPLVAYSSTNKILVQSVLSFYVKYVLPLFLVMAMVMTTDAFGQYLMPMSFMLLFLPALSKHQRLIVLIVMFIVFFADLGARSNVLKFGIPIIILIIYYVRKWISVKILEAVRIFFFIAPFILFALAATNTFNIFNMEEYIDREVTTTGTDYRGRHTEIDVLQDTRTFLYEEVIHSAIKNNYVMFGRTPARGNDSQTFGLIEGVWTGRTERLANEIGIANVFTWTGIVGVILYMLVFYKATYLAVRKSKNIYAKMLGIYIAFRWLYAWVEDVNDFKLNYFMLWVMIGLCFSYSFREMTNKDVLIWVRGIFDTRYTRLQNYLNKKQLYEKSKDSRIDDMS